MIGFLSKLFTGGIGSAAQGVSRAVATFTGDKVQRETNIHDEAMAVHSAFAAENAQLRVNRTWWDSLWDGLSRAPRQLMAFGIIWLMLWPVIDPIAFSAAMEAYSLMPEWLAYVVLAVVGFYFTSRHLEKVKIGGGPTPAQVEAVLETQRKIKALAPQPQPEPSYEEAMASPRPLPNAAIEEWNRRRAGTK